MLKFLAILDYLNNAHDGYDPLITPEGVAIEEMAAHYFHLPNELMFFVYVGEDAITYELLDAESECFERGEITSLKQLRDLHVNGWKRLHQLQVVSA